MSGVIGRIVGVIATLCLFFALMTFVAGLVSEGRERQGDWITAALLIAAAVLIPVVTARRRA